MLNVERLYVVDPAHPRPRLTRGEWDRLDAVCLEAFKASAPLTVSLLNGDSWDERGTLDLTKMVAKIEPVDLESLGQDERCHKVDELPMPITHSDFNAATFEDLLIGGGIAAAAVGKKLDEFLSRSAGKIAVGKLPTVVQRGEGFKFLACIARWPK